MNNIFYNILKTILIIFGFSYLVNELYKNYEKVIIELDLNILIILFIVRLIHLNLISIRNFQFLKICTLYKDKIFDYSLIFFKSLVMNLTFNHTGTAYRAVELKKKGVLYKDFLSIFYITLCFYIIINIFFILFELLIFCNFNIKNKFFIFLFIIFFSIFIFLFPKIVSNLFIYITKLNYNLLKNFTSSVIFVCNTILKQLFLPKISILLIFYSTLLHLTELLFFYIVYKIFYKNIIIIDVFFLLFTVNFILDRIPYVHQIPGIVETIFALISIPLGFSFSNSFFLKLILRFSDIVAIFITYVFVLIIIFFQKKIKFVDVFK